MKKLLSIIFLTGFFSVALAYTGTDNHQAIGSENESNQTSQVIDSKEAGTKDEANSQSTEQKATTETTETTQEKSLLDKILDIFKK